MMPAHYALSDAAILLVVTWAAPALWQKRQILLMLAMACFGMAAAIGVVRFSAGLQSELAALHAGSSQVLGLAAAMAIAAHSLRRTSDRRDYALALAALPVSAGTFFLAPTLIGPLFLLALAIALSVGLLHVFRDRSSWLGPFGLMLLLVNALLIRRAPWLTEAAAWHTYHLLIALGLMVLARAVLHNGALEPIERANEAGTC
ncbi:MAG: hypothetical protein RL339_27 [Pseudomonadota bacterium]|jgi:hypothetical protein